MKNFAADFVASLRSGYALPALRDEIGLLQPAEDPLIQGGILSKPTRPPLTGSIAPNNPRKAKPFRLVA